MDTDGSSVFLVVYYLHQGAIVVCAFVCLFVYLLATLHKMLWKDCNEIFREEQKRHKGQLLMQFLGLVQIIVRIQECFKEFLIIAVSI